MVLELEAAAIRDRPGLLAGSAYSAEIVSSAPDGAATSP